MNIRVLRNQISLGICVAALFIQFAVFEPYIYQDAFKEFTEFNNNFIWMYALFFAVGGVIYSSLCRKKLKSGFYFAFWGCLTTLAGVLSVSLIQTLTRHLKINSITIMMPLIYCVILCLAATVQYAAFDGIVKKIASENKNVVAPICAAIALAAFVLLIVPYHLSYTAVIIASGVLLAASAILVDDSEKNALYDLGSIQNEAENCGINSKVKTSFALGGLIVFTFGIAILVANIRAFAEYYVYRAQDLCVLCIVVAVSVFAGRKLYRKFKEKKVLQVVSAILFFISLLVMTFCRGYVLTLIMSIVAAAGGVIQLSYITNTLRASGFAGKKNFASLSIVFIALAFVLGYWTGVYMTYGGGHMTDILVGIYLEPIRTNSMIAKGLTPDSNGVYAEYSGIGERVALSYKRFAYIPSSFVILISAAICEVAFVANTIVEYKKKKLTLLGESNRCKTDLTDTEAENSSQE